MFSHALLTHLPNTEADVISVWDRNRSDWLLGTTVRAPREDRSYKIDSVRVHCLGLSRIQRLQAAPVAAAYYPAMRWGASRLARPFERRLDAFAEHSHIVHGVRMGREGLALASERAARRAGKPFVFTPFHHPRWDGWRHRVYTDLYKRADALIALTEVEAAILTDLGANPSSITVTGIGPVLADTADPERFRARHHVHGSMVLFLGQHFGYKGWRALLDAAPLVWRHVPDTTLVFAGPPVGGSERSFKNVDSRIKRLGTVNLQTKSDALAACDVLCVPSAQESFGGVFAEAWTLEKPVIGGEAPAVSEVIDDGTDGFVVPQDPSVIAERILTLLLDRSLAKKMGSLGRTKVQGRFSWPALAARTEAIYRDLL